MKTALQELIERITEAQRLVLANDEYAKGYDGALSDCISVAKSFVKKEKEQIEDAYDAGNDALVDWDCEVTYYKETYKK